MAASDATNTPGFAGSALKRGLDVAVALPLLLLTMPIMLVAAAAIALTSRGSPVFSQTRIGASKAPFVCRKLRTMASGTAWVPTHQAEATAITGIGRLLRAAKVDELPQLWNVLAGEMSLVGPRPCLPTQTELIDYRERLGVFRIRPGITGLAQVQGVDMSNPPKLAALDAEYLRNASFAGDLRILLATIVPRRPGRLR